MSREKKLLKDTFIYFIGNFASRFLSIMLLPFYTYFLTPDDYGMVDIVVSTISLIIPIITFQLTDGMYRKLIVLENNETENQIISSSFFTLVRNLIIADVVILAISIFYKMQFLILVILLFNLTVLKEYLLQLTRGLRKNYLYSIGGIISTAVMLSSNLILIAVFKLKAEGLLISYIVSYLVVSIFIVYKIKFFRFLNMKYVDKKIIKDILVYSIPLIPNAINWWFMNVSDRFVINLFLGTYYNGIYAISNKFPQIVQLLCSLFNKAWQDSAITESGSEEREKFYSNVFNNYLIILFTSAIVLLPSTRYIFEFAINEKFSEGYYYIPFLYMGVIFSSFSSFYGIAYQVTKDTKRVFYTSLVGSSLNVIINILLIRVIGLQAASLSTMLAFMVMWIVRIFDTKKYFNFKLNMKTLIKLSTTTCVFIIFYYIDNMILNILSCLISIIIFYIYNKVFIISITTGVYKKIARKFK